MIVPYKILSLVINKIVRIFFIILTFFSIIFTPFAPLNKRVQVPPIKSNLLKISATQLAKKIRKKEVKCVEVIEAYIDRIKDVNPVINSVVQNRFVEALNEAVEIDKFIQNTSVPEVLAITKPLLGVPCSVKETIAVKGLSNNGARSRIASHIAEQDAECVRLLRDAGVIPLVVTNTPELCLNMETINYKYGRTNNPYDPRRTVSGSSGGEAALLGAGASIIGIGSDVAGSLRFPAMFCGIYSHKPSPGFVSNSGHVPTSADPMWDVYFTIGPMARYAKDLPVMLEHMIPDRNHIERLALNDDVNLANVKVYYMYGEGKTSTLQHEPNFQVKKAVKLAADILNSKYNCCTTKVDLSYFKNSFALSLLLLQMNGVENIYQKNDENPDDYDMLSMLYALFKKLTFQSDASLTAVLYGPLKCLSEHLPNEFNDALKTRLEYMKKKVLELLGDDGVLIYPTFPCEAPYHGRMSGHIINVSYCIIFNILGLPVTQCPIRFTREGLPVGVQIIAAPQMDRLSLAVAKSLEKYTAGWKPPDYFSELNQK